MTKLLSHGSDRRQPVLSRSQRTLRALVSSMPSTVVGSARAATARQPRKRLVGSVPGDMVLGGDLRHRPVRPGDRRSQVLTQPGREPRARWDAFVRSRHERRGQAAGRHTSRRFRHHSCTRCPDAGRSLTRRRGRSLTPAGRRRSMLAARRRPWRSPVTGARDVGRCAAAQSWSPATGHQDQSQGGAGPQCAPAKCPPTRAAARAARRGRSSAAT